MRQKTVASELSQPSSQIVPQTPLYKTSARPRLAEPMILTGFGDSPGRRHTRGEVRQAAWGLVAMPALAFHPCKFYGWGQQPLCLAVTRAREIPHHGTHTIWPAASMPPGPAGTMPEEQMPLWPVLHIQITTSCLVLWRGKKEGNKRGREEGRRGRGGRA